MAELHERRREGKMREVRRLARGATPDCVGLCRLWGGLWILFQEEREALEDYKWGSDVA